MASVRPRIKLAGPHYSPLLPRSAAGGLERSSGQKRRIGSLLLARNAAVIILCLCGAALLLWRRQPQQQQPVLVAGSHREDAEAGAAGAAAAAADVAPSADRLHATNSVSGQIHAAKPAAPPAESPAAVSPAATGVYALTVIDIDGRERKLAEFAGRVTLFVNVASQCGYTASNYAGLTALAARFRSSGLAIVGAPCNQFGGQEPGDAASVRDFAVSHGNPFDLLLAKGDVNGPHTQLLYSWLRRNLPVQQGGGGGTGPGQDLSWNFVKILCDRSGMPRELRGSDWQGPELEALVASLLAEPAAAPAGVTAG